MSTKAVSDSSAIGVCGKHRQEGYKAGCEVCQREREAYSLAEVWDEGEAVIPAAAPRRALEILNWRIIRRALQSKDIKTQLLGILAMRLPEVFSAIADNIWEIAEALNQEELSDDERDETH